MDTITRTQITEQDMHLPQGQDAVLDMAGWSGTGPLPTAALEQGARTLFMLDHADWQWHESLSGTRDEYRRRYLQLRARVLRDEQWTLGTMVAQLEAGFGRIVFGDRGATEREQELLHAYAEACIAGLFATFMGDAHALKGATRS